MSPPRTPQSVPAREPTPARAERVRIGVVHELRRRLPSPRRRPLLVRAYGALFQEEGTLGPAARRRVSRLAIRSLPTVVTGAVVALLQLDVFSGQRVGWPQGAAGAALVVTLVGVVWRRAARAIAGQPITLRAHLELGGLVVAAAYTLAQAASRTGAGLDGPFYPVVYLVMAFLVAFLPRVAGLVLVAFAVGLEMLLSAGGGLAGAAAASVGGASALPVLSAGTMAHAGFIVLFAVLYHAVLAAQVASGRRAQQAAVQRRLREIEERAREFRLTDGGDKPEDGDPEDARRRWNASAVVEVEAAVRGALEVAEVALRTHTCGLFLLSPDDKELVLRECRSRSDSVSRSPLPAGEGPLGVVVKRRTPVRLHGAFKGANYYEDGTRPRALLAVPLIDRRGDHLRGVLVADRLDLTPFTEADEQLLATLSAEMLRAIASERLMTDMKRHREEKEHFYQAIEQLNQANKLADVFRVTLDAAGGVLPVDFGALTLVQAAAGSGAPVHRVALAVCPGGKGSEEPRGPHALEGREFPDNTGLVASAVRLASSLPGKDLKPSEAVVFDSETRLKGLQSIKVFPLKAGESVLGTLVLGSRRRAAFHPDATRMLEVMALQAAQSILRARLFEQAERMAITDGLTGLLNHRTLQSRLDEHMASALRYGKRLSLAIVDIDHFKSVNDTYGHPVGDAVLRGVAQILQAEARATDLVARYGGEEFAILMPETDAAGALVIAERVRERLQAHVFQTDMGPLRVTLSCGIATCPENARQKPALIEAADGCLYEAKRHGRNRSISAGPQAHRATSR